MQARAARALDQCLLLEASGCYFTYVWGPGIRGSKMTSASMSTKSCRREGEPKPRLWNNGYVWRTYTGLTAEAPTAKTIGTPKKLSPKSQLEARQVYITSIALMT